MPKLTGKLKHPLLKTGPKKVKQRPPLWAGPEGAGPNGGVTQSMVASWLSCRERFRVKHMEGWRPIEGFNAKIEFGQMWHTCEEALAGEDPSIPSGESRPHWEFRLTQYVQSLLRKFPLDQQQIVHWYEVIKMQFPLYVRYWAENPDVTARTPLLQEAVFDVPYRLPSGRTVRLRGKWDAVDLIGTGKGAGVYLAEHKTKQRIDETKIKRMLSFDLQTMLYLTALQAYQFPDGVGKGKRDGLGAAGIPIAGVRYNVVRRSEHRVGKKETQQEFIDRLRGIIEEAPGGWFMRWRVEVTPADVQRFRRECLDPILEAMCNWYMEQTDALAGTQARSDYLTCFSGSHFRMPFGADNTVSEFGWSDLDEYITSGSTIGLERRESLFGELQ